MGLNPEEDIKRRPVELNLKAARKRQSAQTGFVHHCYASDENHRETIPVFENFCFALALLRSKLSDNVLEGIALLHKLLPFEKEGNFPVYLHEFPQCRDRMLSVRLLPLLHWILHDFHTILDKELQQSLQQLIARILANQEKEHLLLQAYAHPSTFSIGDTFSTPEQLAQALIAAQMAQSRAKIDIDWHSLLQCGHPQLLTYSDVQEQEMAAPKPTLFDVFLCDYQRHYPERILADHPMHLRAALVYPLEKGPSAAMPIPFSRLSSHPRQPFTLYWGSSETVHSLVCDPKQSQCRITQSENRVDFLFDLHTPPSEMDVFELGFFCNLHPDHSFSIQGKPATAFALNEIVQIRSQALMIELCFSLEEGEGIFFGHLSRGNRPLQCAAKGERRYETYDWHLGLRTIKRAGNCTLRACINTILI